MDGGAGSGSGNVTRFELPMDLRTLEGKIAALSEYKSLYSFISSDVSCGLPEQTLCYQVQ